MIEKDIKEIISNYEGLSYLNVENSGEGKLFGVSVDYIDTLLFSEEQYWQWVNMLDNIDIIKPNFQIYCSYDKSGYDFWKNTMEESNHTYIDIWVNDDFSDSDFTSLISELDKLIKMFDDFLNKNNL